MKKIIAVSIFVLLSASIFAGTLRGKDYVQNGTVKTVSGTLFSQDGEWYMKSGSSVTALHMGPSFYHDEIKLQLKDNQNVEANGYMYKNDLAVVTIKVDNKVYNLRDKDGIPLWAGKGNRQGNGLRSKR